MSGALFVLREKVVAIATTFSFDFLPRFGCVFHETHRPCMRSPLIQADCALSFFVISRSATTRQSHSRHCEECNDEAISRCILVKTVRDCRASLAMTKVTPCYSLSEGRERHRSQRQGGYTPRRSLKRSTAPRAKPPFPPLALQKIVKNNEKIL